MIKGKPFVKWAGGKRQILDKLKKYIPVFAKKLKTDLISKVKCTIPGKWFM